MGADVENDEVQIYDSVSDFNLLYGYPIQNQVKFFYNLYSTKDDSITIPSGSSLPLLGNNKINDMELAPFNYFETQVDSEISPDSDGDNTSDSSPGEDHKGYNGVINNGGILMSDGVMDVVVNNWLHPETFPQVFTRGQFDGNSGGDPIPFPQY